MRIFEEIKNNPVFKFISKAGGAISGLFSSGEVSQPISNTTNNYNQFAANEGISLPFDKRIIENNITINGATAENAQRIAQDMREEIEYMSSNL
jgi:hypothetical protein